jgi:phosphoglucosamine mutase
MREGGWNLGGEQSGHIVMTDYATTGDGLMAALQFLAEMVRTGRPASELARRFEPVPQMLENVRFAAGTDPLGDADVKAAIAEGEARWPGQGRVLIRKSGTEPLIRVMAEAEDEALMGRVVEEHRERGARGGLRISCAPAGRVPFVSGPASGGSVGWGRCPRPAASPGGFLPG